MEKIPLSFSLPYFFTQNGSDVGSSKTGMVLLYMVTQKWIKTNVYFVLQSVVS
jgi:hypothetical protein